MWGSVTQTERPCQLGVLAFGDSITNGGGELQWGVALQSWALWTARGLGLPYSPYAVDGAGVQHVLEVQIPTFQRTSRTPAGRYQLGCLYIGINDVRGPDFDPAHFEPSLDAGFKFLAARCERVLTATIPLDMGRPRNRERVTLANDIIDNVARANGTLVLDNPAALAAATLNYSSGTLSFSNITTATLAALTGTNNNLVLANAASAPVTLTVGNNGGAVYAGNLSGSGSLVMTGTGTQIIGSGRNGGADYSGTTTIKSGTLTLRW